MDLLIFVCSVFTGINRTHCLENSHAYSSTEISVDLACLISESQQLALILFFLLLSFGCDVKQETFYNFPFFSIFYFLLNYYNNMFGCIAAGRLVSIAIFLLD